MLSSHLFGFQFADNQDEIRSRFIKKHCDKHDALHKESGNSIAPDWEWLHGLFEKGTPVKQFFLTATFVNSAQLVQVKNADSFSLNDPHPYKWLIDHIEPGIHQFNFGDSFIRWQLEGNVINFFFANRSVANEHVFINGDGSSLNLATLPITYPTDTYQQAGTDLLLQLVVFWMLGPVQISTVGPKQRFLNKRNPQSFFNKTIGHVTVLDSPVYADYIRRDKINWTLHHYPDGSSRTGRTLEKRPNKLAV